jgi:hypothetical protein
MAVSRIVSRDLAGIFRHLFVTCTELHKVDLRLYQASGISAVDMRIVQLQLVILPKTDGTNIV